MCALIGYTAAIQDIKSSVDSPSNPLVWYGVQESPCSTKTQIFFNHEQLDYGSSLENIV